MFLAVHFNLWRCTVQAAAVAVLFAFTGCGASSDQNAATQFRPVDEEPVTSAKPPASPNTSTAAGKTENTAAGKTEKPENPNIDTGGKSVAQPAKPNAPKKNRPQGKQATEDEGDPALVGPTADKVRLIRTILQSLEREQPGKRRDQQVQQAIETAEQILAVEEAPPEARDEALLARFQVSSLLMQENPDNQSKEMLTAAATDLAQASSPQMSTLGRVQLFKIHALDVLQLKPADAQEVVTALKTLLEAGGDAEIIAQGVIPLIMQLEQIGYPRDGVAALSMVGDHFAASEKQNESLMGKQLQLSALIGKLRDSKGVDKEKLSEEIISKAQGFVEVTKADPGALELLYRLAHFQESEAPQLAGQLYDLIEKSYGEHSDEKVASKARSLIDGGRTRMKLVGQPLAVEGVLIGGKPFDWQKYQGEVVLVHFWAIAPPANTQASLQDLSNIQRIFKKYGDRGLKVVGINVDNEVEELVEQFEKQPLAWSNVVGADETQRGVNHPTAKEVGVTLEAVPLTVLIDADGKVVAVGLQGPVLDEAIVKLLPSGDKKPAKEDVPAPEKPDEESKPDEEQKDIDETSEDTK